MLHACSLSSPEAETGDCECKASATEQTPVSNNIQRDINVVVGVDVVVHS